MSTIGHLNQIPFEQTPLRGAAEVTIGTAYYTILTKVQFRSIQLKVKGKKFKRGAKAPLRLPSILIPNPLLDFLHELSRCQGFCQVCVMLTQIFPHFVFLAQLLRNFTPPIR